MLRRADEPMLQFVGHRVVVAGDHFKLFARGEV